MLMNSSTFIFPAFSLQLPDPNPPGTGTHRKGCPQQRQLALLQSTTLMRFSSSLSSTRPFSSLFWSFYPLNPGQRLFESGAGIPLGASEPAPQRCRRWCVACFHLFVKNAIVGRPTLNVMMVFSGFRIISSYFPKSPFVSVQEKEKVSSSWNLSLGTNPLLLFPAGRH